MGVVVVVAAVVVVVVVVAGEPSAACTGGTPGASSQLRRPGRKKEKEILERSVNPNVGRRPCRFLLAFLATAHGFFFSWEAKTDISLSLACGGQMPNEGRPPSVVGLFGTRYL